MKEVRIIKMNKTILVILLSAIIIASSLSLAGFFWISLNSRGIQAQDLQSQLTEKLQQITDLNAQIATYQKQLAQKEQDLLSLQTNITALQNAYSNLTTERDGLKEQLYQANIALQNAEYQILELKAQIFSLNNQISDLNNQIGSLIEKINSLTYRPAIGYNPNSFFEVGQGWPEEYTLNASFLTTNGYAGYLNITLDLTNVNNLYLNVTEIYRGQAISIYISPVQSKYNNIVPVLPNEIVWVTFGLINKTIPSEGQVYIVYQAI